MLHCAKTLWKRKITCQMLRVPENIHKAENRGIISFQSCIPMVSRSSTGSRLATKGSPPTSTSTSSLHPVTQKPVKKHMRICPTWQLREEALHKAAQQVRRQNERLGTQHKLEDETEAEDDETSNPDSQNTACEINERWAQTFIFSPWWQCLFEWRESIF